MKQFFILVFLLFIVLMNINAYAFSAKKIDLKTNKDETDIIFLKLKGSTSLLISETTQSKLFFINYKDNRGVNETLNILGLNPKMYFLNKHNGYKNIKVVNDNFIKLAINNYNICIVRNIQEVNSCDFIYLLSLNEEFKVNDNTMAVFYDENIKDDYLIQLNESWIDSHIVSIDSFTILKLGKEEYNILVIPLANN